MRLLCYVCLIVGAVLLFADRIETDEVTSAVRKDSSEMTNGPALSAKLLSKIFLFSGIMIFSHFRNFLSPVLEGVAAIRKPIDTARE